MCAGNQTMHSATAAHTAVCAQRKASVTNLAMWVLQYKATSLITMKPTATLHYDVLQPKEKKMTKF